MVDGFTIRGAGGFGAILCEGSSPTIRNCIISGNGPFVGGIDSLGGSPVIVNCTISSNHGGLLGGGAYFLGGAPLIANRLIAGNIAFSWPDGGYGGGAYFFGCDALLVNCAFSGNDALYAGSGLYNDSGSVTLLNCTFSRNKYDGLTTWGTARAVNCIFWENGLPGGNVPSQVFDGSGGATVSFSNVQGGWPGAGAGNIDDDPLFVDPHGADGLIGTPDDNLRLRPGSPCIDAGDGSALPPAYTIDLGGSARRVDDLDAPDCPQAPGTCGPAPVADMGAYEAHLPCPWDLDYSAAVGDEDVAALLSAWGSAPIGPPDFDSDGAVGIADLLALLARWGPCCGPGTGKVPDCNTNGFPDACDVDGGVSDDCNANGVPDECDFAGCAAGQVPQDCRVADCNGNGIHDLCDVTSGTSDDCDGDQVPDECQELACEGCTYESAKLLASDGNTGDQFGWSVSLSGGTALIGAPNASAASRGAAYVLRFGGSGWSQERMITPGDAAPRDLFGRSVSISDDVALIGSESTPGGSAYVFRFDGSSWAQEQKLIAADAAPDDGFGRSVHVDGTVAVVGAPKDDDGGPSSGSAYVFRFDGSSWEQEQKLVAWDGVERGRFGASVAVHGTVAMIGAPNDFVYNLPHGSVYVFRFDGSSWAPVQRLTASDAAVQDWFGASVSISGDVALIGASGSSAAYVFRFDGEAWVEEARLAGSHGGVRGNAVSVSGDVIVLGGWDSRYADQVFVYLFDRQAGRWVEQARLTASDAGWNDHFGETAVSSSGVMALIGAPGDDDQGTYSGSTYVFRGLSDCNATGTLDLCDIAGGASRDADGDGVPDECDSPP